MISRVTTLLDSNVQFSKKSQCMQRNTNIWPIQKGKKSTEIVFQTDLMTNLLNKDVKRMS